MGAPYLHMHPLAAARVDARPNSYTILLSGAVHVPKRILVLEDSGIMRDVCRGILEKKGYEVIEAGNAPRALEALKQQHIDLMFCDLNIPGTDGLEFVEAIRHEPALAALPVVMVTVERGPELLARAQRAGIKDWLSKPYDAKQLLALAERFAGPTKPAN